MSGNEAIARGAWEAGVRVAASYPGTPSTEILEHLATYPEVHAQWSPNEKVAVEFAFGASLGGARTMVTMKHVGLNVAADPLFTMAYAGVSGGLVLVSADDPGMHSSQNEQDNRNLGRAAKIPVLEPTDSQTALVLAREAFALSERFDIPVLLRTTTRVCHATTVVQSGEREEVELRPYRKQMDKYLMLPSVARARRVALEERLRALEEWANDTPLNRVSMRDRSIGVLSAGVAAQYAAEVLPHASTLDLAVTFPFPRALVRRFAEQVDRLVVVEELDPVLETEVRAMGLECVGKEAVPSIGELSPGVVARALGVARPPEREPVALPPRPPVLCAGCGHRPVFYVLHELGCTVLGDIGCYTLGAYEPLDAMDTNLCMGAAIGMAHGMEKALELGSGRQRRLVAVIGDSTFVHSGITGLIDLVYNRGATTVVILDNSTTAMTGHQDHPGSGRTLAGDEAPRIDFEALARALGIERVTAVNPYQVEEVRNVLLRELAADEPSVVIARAGCALVALRQPVHQARIDAGDCTLCGACLGLGCPAIIDAGDNRVPKIDPVACVGCGACSETCEADAIQQVPR
jgi:indolepyruvate ferredoxin oxidoreductase alpha subunit